jgi:hypothetical protein
LLGSCDSTTTTVGTGSPTSPAPVSPSPSPGVSPLPSRVLSEGDCAAGSVNAASTPSQALGADGEIKVMIPAGWLDRTKEITGTNVLLGLQAPASYGVGDTYIYLAVVAGPRRGSSSSEQARADAAGRTSLGPQTPIGACLVAGDQASFYSYTSSSGDVTYRLLILHNPSAQYPVLYAVQIGSPGAMDDRAKRDVRSLLASWTWTT